MNYHAMIEDSWVFLLLAVSIIVSIRMHRFYSCRKEKGLVIAN